MVSNNSNTLLDSAEVLLTGSIEWLGFSFNLFVRRQEKAEKVEKVESLAVANQRKLPNHDQLEQDYRYPI